MLTWDDCLALCDLTADEVAAIAEHEHLTQMAAAELGNYLIHSPDGAPKIRRIILDDIETAQARGDYAHAVKLKLVLRRFVQSHGPARAA